MRRRYNTRRIKTDGNGYIVGYVASTEKPDNITYFDRDDPAFSMIKELGMIDRYGNPQFKIIDNKIEFEPQEPEENIKISKDYESDYPLARRVEMIEKGIENPQDIDYLEYLRRKGEANVARIRNPK